MFYEKNIRHCFSTGCYRAYWIWSYHPYSSSNITTIYPLGLIGILLANYSFYQFFAPFLGKLSDKIGRKPVLIGSKVGTIVSYILLAYSNTYYLLLISRLLDGFTGGNIAVARAYLSDISSEQNRSKAMAIVGIGFATGFIIGPAIGGFCYQMANDFFGCRLCWCWFILTITYYYAVWLKKHE